MYYVIANGSGKNKLDLTRVERGMCATWDSDGLGRMVCKVKRVPVRETGKEKGLQVVGHYNPDAAKARKFRTREKAEQLIAENRVLRFCHVEEM